jgi:hypothetical protein
LCLAPFNSITAIKERSRRGDYKEGKKIIIAKMVQHEYTLK